MCLRMKGGNMKAYEVVGGRCVFALRVVMYVMYEVTSLSLCVNVEGRCVIQHQSVICMCMFMSKAGVSFHDMW